VLRLSRGYRLSNWHACGVLASRNRPMMNDSKVAKGSASGWSYSLQAMGALVWCLFFILSPMEVLLLGSVVWIPLLIWREKLRSRRHGFLPGAILRGMLVLSVVVAAALAPVKYVDRRILQLPRGQLTLGQLTTALEEQAVLLRFPNQHANRSVRLPGGSSKVRELIDLIEDQTGLRHRIKYCGNGSTVLWGGVPMGRIRFEERSD